jgi:hypothetical protein
VRDNYQFEYPDLSDVFTKVINHPYVNNKFNTNNPFQILLHNGDNDLVCDHIEAEYFVEGLKIKAVIKVRYNFVSLNEILTLRHMKMEIENHGELICLVVLREKMLL